MTPGTYRPVCTGSVAGVGRAAGQAPRSSETGCGPACLGEATETALLAVTQTAAALRRLLWVLLLLLAPLVPALRLRPCLALRTEASRAWPMLQPQTRQPKRHGQPTCQWLQAAATACPHWRPEAEPMHRYRPPRSPSALRPSGLQMLLWQGRRWRTLLLQCRLPRRSRGLSRRLRRQLRSASRLRVGGPGVRATLADAAVWSVIALAPAPTGAGLATRKVRDHLDL